MAAPTTMHFHSCTFIHAFHPIEGVFVIVLYITSLSTNEIGRYLNYIQKTEIGRARDGREGRYC